MFYYFRNGISAQDKRNFKIANYFLDGLNNVRFFINCYIILDLFRLEYHIFKISIKVLIYILNNFLYLLENLSKLNLSLFHYIL